jgi:hypothetical protein
MCVCVCVCVCGGGGGSGGGDGSGEAGCMAQCAHTRQQMSAVLLSRRVGTKQNKQTISEDIKVVPPLEGSDSLESDHKPHVSTAYSGSRSVLKHVDAVGS